MSKATNSRAKEAGQVSEEAAGRAAAASEAMPEAMRELAESGVARLRGSYETFKSLANDSSATAETIFDAMSRNAVELNRSAVAAAKASVVGGFDHLETLMGARTLAEAAELQLAFVRRRFEETADQARSLQDRLGKAVEDVAAPAGEGLSRTLAAMKSGA